MSEEIRFQEIDPLDERKMEQALRFRYHIMYKELGLSRNKDFNKGLESDSFDPYAKHYGAYVGDELIAYVRFIYDSPIGYPTTVHMEMPPQTLLIPKESVSEISRIFIRKEYRRLKTARTILQTFMKDFIYPEAKKKGIRYFYGALQAEFLRLLNRFKIPYKPITPLQEYRKYGGGKRYGALLDLEEYERIWKLCGKEL